MHRWFYANEELICQRLKETETVDTSGMEERKWRPQWRTWRFCVTLREIELMPNEFVAVTGNCDELGNWQVDDCVMMKPAPTLDFWFLYLDIPAHIPVTYRYLIVARDFEAKLRIVRFFESHLKPRTIQPQAKLVVDVCEDVFGLVEGNEKVERGWLTNEHIVQLMFLKGPFKWNSKTFPKDQVIRVKVTPAFRKDMGDCLEMDSSEPECSDDLIKVSTSSLDEDDLAGADGKNFAAGQGKPQKCAKKILPFTKLSTSCRNLQGKQEEEEKEKDIGDGDKNNERKRRKQEENRRRKMRRSLKELSLSTAFAFNEVVNVNEQDDFLMRQPEFGRKCEGQDLVMCHLTIGDFNNTVYLIELFTCSKNPGCDEVPYRVGYRYILPEDFENLSQGYMEAPIICATKHRPVGSMIFRFLIIHPAKDLTFDLSISHLRHWNMENGPLEVGHRGQGKSFYTDSNNIVYENTIYSMQQAVKSGAHMVEFDVHLTKDFVPIIYHDFHVHLSKTDMEIFDDSNPLNIPINKFTHKELRQIKIDCTAFGEEEIDVRPIDEAPESHQLFPTLADTFDAIPESVAFDIELKWPQQFCNGKWEENIQYRIDRNLYIDLILKVVMEKAGNRRIVFSCFDADMCSMLRFKQNRYPVMLLLLNWQKMPFLDPRTKPPVTAMNFAHAMELLGINPHCSSLLQSASFITDTIRHRLVLFCYGVEYHEDLTLLKNMNVCAVILDRIDKLAKRTDCECNYCQSDGQTILEDF